jgi:hypothetical protein
MVVSCRIWSLGFEPVWSSLQDGLRLRSPPGVLLERMVTTGPVFGVFCTMEAGGGTEGRLGCELCAEPAMRPSETLTRWSRTLLKSSRKMVSEAHLKTSASYALISVEILFHSRFLSVPTRQ